jgi:hypothetical protein
MIFVRYNFLFNIKKELFDHLNGIFDHLVIKNIEVLWIINKFFISLQCGVFLGFSSKEELIT